MKRVVAYIDGFNMYHAINSNMAPHYKWLDYRKLVESFLEKDETLVKILIFTATPRYDDDKIKRHHNYMRVLKNHSNIEIVAGNFTRTQKQFNFDKQTVVWPIGAKVKPKKFAYLTFEEKQTDVNLALEIFEGGILDIYDKALIFSGDSDIAPSILKVKKHKKAKKFKAILPLNGDGRVISSTCGESDRVTVAILDKCLLPKEINIFGVKIVCPYPYPKK